RRPRRAPKRPRAKRRNRDTRPGPGPSPLRGLRLGGAADPRDDPQHRAPAPVDPRGAAPRRPRRRRARLRRAAGDRLHASRLREARRGAQLPPDHDHRQPDRLGGRLRQRDPLHHRRREAHGARGAAPGALDPPDPHRDGPDGLSPHLHGLLPARAGGADPAVLRPPGAGACPRPARGSHRRPVPSQLQPHRRRQARLRLRLEDPQAGPGPPQDLLRGDPAGHGRGPARLRPARGPGGRQRDHPRPDQGHRRPPARGGGRLRGHRPQPARLRRAVRPPQGRELPALRPVRLPGHHHPERRLLGQVVVPPPGDPRVGEDRPAGDRLDPLRPDPGQGAQGHQGAQGRDVRQGREPQGRDGLLPRLRRWTGPVPAEDPLGVVLEHLGAAVDPRGGPRPRHHRHHGLARLRSGRRGPMSLIADIMANFWLGLIIKLLIVALLAPVIGMIIGFAEMKLSAKMQNRVGPYYAGGRWGWAQLIADGLKLFQKEDVLPAAADRQVFKLAPALVLAATVALVVVIPFGPDMAFRNLELGLFYALAISSLSTIGVLVAGWSSANKYSLIGSLRAAGQLIAYELPLV